MGRVELEGPKAQKQRARGLQGRAAVSRLDEEIRGAPRGGADEAQDGRAHRDREKAVARPRGTRI